MAYLATGSGEAALGGALEIYQPVVARQNQVPTSFYNPAGPMVAPAPYNHSQYYYRKSPPPARVSDTNQNTKMENVTVKEGTENRNRLIKEFFLVAFGLVVCGIPLAVIGTLYAQQSELK